MNALPADRPADAPADQEARDRIREDHGATLFVEAGAGTGKTTALVARVVHMVATGHLHQVGRLAAITFTENAAAELRSRIREGLGQGARGEHRGTSYDQAQRERCGTALDHLDDAVVTTLHGFASRILAEAPLEAGLPPGFSVADTMTTGAGADDAWRAFVDGLLDDLSVREHLLLGLSLDLRLTDLRDLAAALATSWDRLVERPLRHRPLPAVDAAPVVGALRRALADEDRWPEGDKLTAHLRGPVTSLLAELEPLTEPLDVLETLGTVRIRPGHGSAGSWTAAGLRKPAVVEALKQAEAARAALVAAVGAAVTETLAATVQGWVLEQAARRRDEGSLDFHDLLVLARDLLRDNASVRRRLHETWPVLLVDEFQDTDPLQVEIACLLAGDCGEVPPEHWSGIRVPAGRLFFVGDPKQSIYRFRRADVRTYSAVGRVHQAGRAGLAVNFRSVPGVVDAANHAFATLIGADPAAGIGYADLVASRPTGAPAGPPVLLLGGPGQGGAVALREAEAAHVADVAVRARAQGWGVEDEVRLADGSRGRRTRPVSYADMAVLLPTRTSLPALEKALQARDVPYRVESRSLIWSTDAVRDLVTLLQAVDNPADQVALVAALRHAGLACSDVDLLTWRAGGGRWSYLADPPEDVPDTHPVAAAMATLRAWHEARWWRTPSELADTVVRELRLVELTSAQRRPRDHWRRLRFVVDQARAWCDAGGSGLGGFVDWAVQQIDSDADVLETVVPEPDDDAVRILTVHGSKGLEFPVTIVAGLASAAGGRALVHWSADGPQVRLRAGRLEMAGWAEAAADDREESRRETTRLLYVALTRAMDHLVLGCYHRPPRSRDAQRSSAQQLWQLLSSGPLARVETEVPATGRAAAVAEPCAQPAPAALPDRAAFAAGRSGLLAAIAARVATSPTALVEAAAAAGPAAEPGDTAAGEPADDLGAHAPTPRPRRTSRHGAAIGTAVHRVLELVDLREPTAEEVRRLAELACGEQQIPALVGDVEARAWSALAADVVRSAALAGRTWREVYLVVRDGERYVEGYVDLLAEDADGRLTVVDYKTDRVDSAADVAAKQAHYAPQLAEYTRAITRILDTDDVAARLVFAGRSPSGPPDAGSTS